MIDIVESNFFPKATILCEPQLSKRGFYPDLSIKNSVIDHKTTMNILAYSDGNNSLLDIANIINKPFWEILPLTKKLINFELLK
jgi:aminopeptidase-like protein